MEEKERFELFGEHCIKDNNPDARCQLLDTYKACVILNEQDKENHQLKQQLEYTEESYNRTMAYLNTIRSELLNLPKKIVEYIKFSKGFYFDWEIGQKIFPAFKITEEDLDAILKKYGGEDE